MKQLSGFYCLQVHGKKNRAGAVLRPEKEARRWKTTHARRFRFLAVTKKKGDGGTGFFARGRRFENGTQTVLTIGSYRGSALFTNYILKNSHSTGSDTSKSVKASRRNPLFPAALTRRSRIYPRLSVRVLVSCPRKFASLQHLS
mgnify:CR=1 FL=1